MFRFRLARDLGMTVEELEERMSAEEFRSWIHFCAAEAREHKRQQEAQR